MKNNKAYLTVLKEVVNEIEPIKGSRFIAHFQPLSSEQVIHTELSALKLKYPGARHYCWAFQIFDKQTGQAIARFNDDGEPHGSAGKPILAPILGKELYNVIIFVVRYFGGVKLGVGGLVRAYGHCSNEVIARAIEKNLVVNRKPKKILEIRFAYEDTTVINSILNVTDQQPLVSEYGEQVSMTFSIELEKLQAFKNMLIEGTSGRIKLK